MFGMMGESKEEGDAPKDEAKESEVTPKRWKEESGQAIPILPNSQLTRPGNWKYETTPLR